MALTNRIREMDNRLYSKHVERNWQGTKYNKYFTRVGQLYSLGDFRQTFDCYFGRQKRPSSLVRIDRTVNPFQSVKVKSYCVPGFVYTNRNTTRDGGLNFSLNGEICSFSGPKPEWSVYPSLPVRDREKEYTVAKLYTKPGNAQHEFGVSIGELGETLRMLGNPLKSIANLTSAILDHRVSVHRFLDCIALSGPLSKKARSGVKRVARNGLAVVDEASNLWIEYRYGVRPLIGEVQSIMKLYADGVKKRTGDVERSKTGYGFEPIITNGSGATNVSGFNFRFAEVTKVEEQINSGLYYMAEWNLPNLDNLASYGLAPWQVLGTAWELVPLSFVVDRFVDISTFLKNLTPDPRIKYLRNWVTHTRKVTFSRNLYPVDHYSYGDKAYGKAGFYEFCQMNMRREVDYPRTSLPVWNPKTLSFVNAFDHVALLWQRLPDFLDRRKLDFSRAI